MRCIFLACLILSVVQAFKVPVVRCNDLSIKLCARLPYALKDRSTDSLSQAPQPIFERIDYLVTDSTELPEEERPSFISAVSNPRDLQALLLLFFGLLISASNVIGSYGEIYISLEETAIYLGVLNGLAGIIQQLTGYQITRSGRAGIADDGLVTFFGGIYSSAVTWLAWRASAACPLWLPKYDQLASAAAISAFTFGIIVPAVTLYRDSSHNQTSIPSLSVTEKLRVNGILALGVLGAVFIPDCIAFGSGGETWWLRAGNTTLLKKSLQDLFWARWLYEIVC